MFARPLATKAPRNPAGFFRRTLFIGVESRLEKPWRYYSWPGNSALIQHGTKNSNVQHPPMFRLTRWQFSASNGEFGKKSDGSFPRKQSQTKGQDPDSPSILMVSNTPSSSVASPSVGPVTPIYAINDERDGSGSHASTSSATIVGDPSLKHNISDDDDLEDQSEYKNAGENERAVGARTEDDTGKASVVWVDVATNLEGGGQYEVTVSSTSENKHVPLQSTDETGPTERQKKYLKVLGVKDEEISGIMTVQEASEMIALRIESRASLASNEMKLSSVRGPTLKQLKYLKALGVPEEQLVNIKTLDEAFDMIERLKPRNQITNPKDLPAHESTGVPSSQPPTEDSIGARLSALPSPHESGPTARQIKFMRSLSTPENVISTIKSSREASEYIQAILDERNGSASESRISLDILMIKQVFTNLFSGHDDSTQLSPPSEDQIQQIADRLGLKTHELFIPSRGLADRIIHELQRKEDALLNQWKSVVRATTPKQ